MLSTDAAIAVLGPGGVGGLLGGLLARGGRRVIFLARPDTAAALRRDGLTVRSRRYGDFTVPVDARTELDEPVEACLIAVKQTTLAAALGSLPPDVLGDGLVVPLLNGTEHMAALRERYPSPQVIAGTIRVESTRIAPGRIEHASPFAAIELGSRTTPRDRLDGLAERLRAAELDVTVSDDETAMLWNKLSFLATLALLTTHAGAAIGEVREGRREELLAVAREIAAVAGAAGGTLGAEDVVTTLDRVDAGMKSSMLRDAEAGRELELDAIGGAVLRAAEVHGLDVPVTAALVADLRDRERLRTSSGVGSGSGSAPGSSSASASDSSEGSPSSPERAGA
ncbi:ketopantoate reductase family protein [Actinomadura sp. HBU206391]|uniref:ketopantoate reductase family protein n=1 Tax=Actinomadura sp. HBU206391 TaxID=2731692 RepID=UPI001C9CCE5A|nr:2-dehydropantoate 2-reductase [Actinomadura sp. HBU206391]